jgi:putative SOS response-associated peptidase YedK
MQAALRREGASAPAERFNVAPGERLPVVFPAGKDREVREATWGLIPTWTAPGEPVRPLVNARAETVDAKPAFRDAFRERRCIVPADGFYEWKTTGGQKRPFFFRLREDRPFGFAAIWNETRGPDGVKFRTFCLLTTEPNALMEPIHDRMPVMLNEDRMFLWLDVGPDEAGKILRPLLWPYPAAEMEMFPVNPWVNRAGNEGPRCLEPWTGEEREQMSLF